MAEKVLMKGNEALAESALRAGCRFFFGYPITPQTELAAYMSKQMPKVGGTYLQAESEVAAINMVYGASAAGARVMTSSSSPGISLKSEGISYMAGADLPGVIINIQRGGPGLGSIQPSQSDYWQATRATGHGDFQIVVYAPSTVQEMADVAFNAFDVADRYRTPVMILGDGLLGQMMEPVVLPDPVDPADLPAKPWATTGHKHARPHNVANSLYLTAEDLERLNFERYERYEQIKATEQRFEEYLCDDADIVVVAFGASARVARSAVNAHPRGALPPRHAVALPRGRPARHAGDGQGVPGRGDEHGPDGGRRAPGGRGPRAGGVPRPRRRHDPHARGGLGPHRGDQREDR